MALKMALAGVSGIIMARITRVRCANAQNRQRSAYRRARQRAGGRHRCRAAWAWRQANEWRNVTRGGKNGSINTLVAKIPSQRISIRHQHGAYRRHNEQRGVTAGRGAA